MSAAAYDLSKKVLRLCRSCAQRKARFRHQGVVKSDREPPSQDCFGGPSPVGFECFRSERDRRRARLLAEVPSAEPIPFRLQASQVLDGRQLAHRRRMLRHLESVGR